MKKLLTILIFLPLFSFGQSDDLWYKSYDEATKMTSFKDASGQVVIVPKELSIFNVAKRFDKIMAVGEHVDGKIDAYYLLKNGKKFGQGTLFHGDFAYACESEGHIKFQDHEKELVGLYNSAGEVAIPAEYCWITQVKNGLFFGVKDAQKEHIGEPHQGDCNHWRWEGGKKFLMDTTNTVLVEDFEYKSEMNFYSLQISETEIEETGRVNFKGTNGRYYSFIDNKKLFENYFDKLLANLTIDYLIESSFKEIVVHNKEGWTSEPKGIYFKEHGAAILSRLKKVKEDDLEYSIFNNSYLPLPKDLKRFFEDKRDHCGEHNSSKYPIFDLRVNHKRDDNGERLSQECFTFLKVGDDFELIYISNTKK